MHVPGLPHTLMPELTEMQQALLDTLARLEAQPHLDYTSSSREDLLVICARGLAAHAIAEFLAANTKNAKIVQAGTNGKPN